MRRIDPKIDGRLRESELKETLIAVELFGRKPDYDPKLDSTVRTEAMRLRARLKYYTDEGSRDPVVLNKRLLRREFMIPGWIVGRHPEVGPDKATRDSWR